MIQPWKAIMVCLMSSALFIVLLFAFQNPLRVEKGGFQRKYIDVNIPAIKTIDLGRPDHYFAGVGDYVYLGRHSSPIEVRVLDRNLSSITTTNLSLHQTDFDYLKSAQIHIDDDTIYIGDRHTASIVIGRTHDFSARTHFVGTTGFGKFMPVTTSSMVKRLFDPKEKKLLLLSEKLQADSIETHVIHQFPLQSNSLFSADGAFAFNPGGPYVVYVLYYTNKFLVFNLYTSETNLFSTIDTVSIPRIKTAVIDGGNTVTMTAPSLTINSASAVCDGKLYIYSPRIEENATSDKLLSIDTYELSSGDYLGSFKLQNNPCKTISDLRVINDSLIVLCQNYLSVYPM